MSAMVRAMNPMMLAETVKSAIDLCNNIATYRIKIAELQVMREHMHRQADIRLSEIDKNHKREMARMATLSDAHKNTIIMVQREQDKCFILLKAANKSIAQYENIIFSTDINSEQKTEYLKLLNRLFDEKEQLMQIYSGLLSKNPDSFNVLADALRTQPREFIDV